MLRTLEVSEATAADIVQELEPDEAADLMSSLDPERAADILDEMDPDDAADLLGASRPTRPRTSWSGWSPRSRPMSGSSSRTRTTPPEA